MEPQKPQKINSHLIIPSSRTITPPLLLSPPSLPFFVVFQSPAMQGAIIHYIQMAQAQIKTIDTAFPPQFYPIQILWNNLKVNMVDSCRNNGKYKKVTLQSKQALIAMVKGGSSIISASRFLQINYSTAKSIFQNMKVKNHRKCKRRHFIETDSESQSELIKQEQVQTT